ncbi:5'-3' exonuclease H3TH domain-containing protein [Luedemannella flava]|uniref:5'-3' exonuclease n=1 Tax=Luedemannella flava TaxID=349316 RepID=UPI0031D09ECD
MLPASAPLLLVLDGNSLLHRAYHAAPFGEILDKQGRPVWAIRGLVSLVARAAARTRPDAVLIGFDCAEHSARKDDFSGYKAHRAEKPAELVEQLLVAPELLRAAGLGTVVPTSYEADDVLASAAAHARRAGWRSVVVTSDRDSFALIDASTSVLRVRNGGLDEATLMTATTLTALCGVEPWQYRDFAALRGDPSDNLPGVRGFGAATAARLLAGFGTVDAAWAAQDGGDEQAVRAVVGSAASAALADPAMREAVERNRRLMRMRDDLPMPALDSVRLPVPFGRMKRALAERGVFLGPSLWALTGGIPPAGEDDQVQVPQPWMWSPRSRRREPLPGQLALF